MAMTKLENLINPEVMADMISAKIENAIVVTPFAKVEEVKTLKDEKKTLEDDIAKLNENANGNEEVKKELEALKAKIDADAKQAEADRILAEKNADIEKRFAECVGDKKFSHDAIKASYLKKFADALESEEYKGKGDTDIFHALTKDDATAFTGVTAVKLQGGTPQGVGGKSVTREDFNKMSYKERLQIYNENQALYNELTT